MRFCSGGCAVGRAERYPGRDWDAAGGWEPGGLYRRVAQPHQGRDRRRCGAGGEL